LTTSPVGWEYEPPTGAISLPDPLPEGRLPLVVVLGGIGTGEHDIRFDASAGD
jgi:hypothetical protein